MAKAAKKSKKKVGAAGRPDAKKIVRAKSDDPQKKTALLRKNKRAKNKTATSSKALIVKQAAKLSSTLNKAAGCIGLTWVQENSGKTQETISGAFSLTFSSSRSLEKKKTGGAAGRSVKIPNHLPEVLAAVAHPVRLRILVKLLDGPIIYQSLKKLTKLEAGPLYHHIHQLRLAGLILPKQRDLYELTRGGRNAIVAVMSMGSMTRDRRRRTI